VESVVLDKEPLGEMDARVFLYSDFLGKVSAKIRSARRIISKLNPHLEPLNLARVRLIEKNTFQVADALKFGSLPQENFKILRLINSMVQDNHADEELWKLIKSGNLSVKKVLTVLGFDASYSFCGVCEVKNPEFFYITDHLFYCRSCAPANLNPDEFVAIND